MKIDRQVEKFRVRQGPIASNTGDDFGGFLLPGPCGRTLTVIASSGDEESGIDWEHVSVSTPKATPNWSEMCWVKELFFDSEQTVMQLHPPKSRWINNHAYCLHLWRPLKEKIPLPPDITVGKKELGVIHQ